MKYVAKPVEVDAYKILTVFPEVGAPDTEFTLTYRGDDGEWLKLKTTPGMTARMIPRIGDYIIKQQDDYLYLNPANVFERKYQPKKEKS